MKSPTLLLTSAGRRGQLCGCFRDDAGKLGLNLRVLAADLRPELSAACQLADAAFTIPRCTDAAFIPALLKLCREQRVTLLVPTIDPELPVLSRHIDDFAAIGTRVVVAAPETVALARDKVETARFLAAAGVNVPRTLGLGHYRANPSSLSGPVIAKPRGGSSSIGILRGNGPADFAGLPEDYLVQEAWRGVEYTVNVFFDQAGVMKCAIPHERLETRGGEVSKGITRRVPPLERAAQKLATALPGAKGPLCFQAIMTASGDYAVFEINARFGGGYPLAHRAGARFSQWLLEEAAGLPCTVNNDWKEGVTMLRYDSAVFLHG